MEPQEFSNRQLAPSEKRTLPEPLPQSITTWGPRGETVEIITKQSEMRSLEGLVFRFSNDSGPTTEMLHLSIEDPALSNQIAQIIMANIKLGSLLPEIQNALSWSDHTTKTSPSHRFSTPIDHQMNAEPIWNTTIEYHQGHYWHYPTLDHFMNGVRYETDRHERRDAESKNWESVLEITQVEGESGIPISVKLLNNGHPPLMRERWVTLHTESKLDEMLTSLSSVVEAFRELTIYGTGNIFKERIVPLFPQAAERIGEATWVGEPPKQPSLRYSLQAEYPSNATGYFQYDGRQARLEFDGHPSPAEPDASTRIRFSLAGNDSLKVNEFLQTISRLVSNPETKDLKSVLEFSRRYNCQIIFGETPERQTLLLKLVNHAPEMSGYALVTGARRAVNAPEMLGHILQGGQYLHFERTPSELQFDDPTLHQAYSISFAINGNEIRSAIIETNQLGTVTIRGKLDCLIRGESVTISSYIRESLKLLASSPLNYLAQQIGLHHTLSPILKFQSNAGLIDTMRFFSHLQDHRSGTNHRQLLDSNPIRHVFRDYWNSKTLTLPLDIARNLLLVCTLSEHGLIALRLAKKPFIASILGQKVSLEELKKLKTTPTINVPEGIGRSSVHVNHILGQIHEELQHRSFLQRSTRLTNAYAIIKRVLEAQSE